MTTYADAMAIAWQHQQAGNLAEAEAIYRQILDAAPQDVNARYRLATLRQAQGRTADAIDLFQHLLQVRPDAAKVHHQLGLAYASQGRPTEALASYQEAVRLKPDFAEAFNNLGNLHTFQGDWNQAGVAYRQALTLSPQYPAALANLGNVHFKQGRFEEAAHCFEQALALQPPDVVLLNSLGNALLNQGKPREACNAYRQALWLRPDLAETHYNLAWACTALGNWQEAADCWRTSLAHDPTNPKPLWALGDLYYYKLSQFDEALRCYQQVLALSPDDTKAQVLVAALSGTGQYAKVPADYVIATYDESADQFDDYVQFRGDRSPEWLQAALEPAPATPDLLILDLGCGTGRCGLQFRPWAKALIGVDLSPKMIAKARARGVYDELIQTDLASALTDRPGTFDLIVASDVMLYIGDLAPVFQAAHQALRPGGRFAFTVDVAEGPDYQMTHWVHYAHSRTYLDRLAAAEPWQDVRMTPVTFPRGNGHHAAGLVVVLRRPL